MAQILNSIHVKEHAVYTHTPYMGMLPDIFYIKNEI